MKKKLIEISPPLEAINKASAQEEIRVICYPPAPLETEDLGRIWEFAFKYNAYEKLGSFEAVCKLAHEREKVFMDTLANGSEQLMSCEPAYSLNSAAGAIWVKTLRENHFTE